jgi:hypothetical protein
VGEERDEHAPQTSASPRRNPRRERREQPPRTRARQENERVSPSASGSLIRWSPPLMASGRGGDVFQPRWLAVALEAPLRTTVLGTAPA